MSVYYNVKVGNDNEEPVLMKTNETSFIPILENQEKYEVGVKRFKIPTSEIDFYRVYPQRQVMYSNMNLASRSPSQNKKYLTDLFTNTVSQDEHDNDITIEYQATKNTVII